MSRLELTDSGMDVLAKMSDGNPGALMAMTQILEKHDAIDPQAAMGGMGSEIEQASPYRGYKWISK